MSQTFQKCYAWLLLSCLITNTTSVALDTNTLVGLEGVDIINRLTEVQVVSGLELGGGLLAKYQ